MNSTSLLEKKWIEVQFDPQKKEYIRQKYNLSDMLARLLAEKEILIEEVEHFLTPTLKGLLPDPSHLIDMDKATSILVSQILKQEKIGILADFDVDGATSSAVLVRFLKQLGIETLVHIPDRMTEGYGPNLNALNNLCEQGAKSILVLDCGTTNTELFDSFNRCDVIIVDHHVAEEKLPKVAALINPNRQDESSPHKTLCTAGLVFLLIVSVNRELRNSGYYQEKAEPDLISFLDLVALGTVCDMMSLTGLNRAYVTQGLKVLNLKKNLGLRTLGDMIGIKDDISAYHLGFMIGPRINAGGRIGQSNLGVRLLTEETEEEARAIAAHLDYLNQERQRIEQKMTLDAFFQAEEKQDKSVLVIARSDYHQGIIGIIAGRVKERFYKPTVVISINEEGIGKASARSISGFNIGALFHKAAHEGVIMSGGGHSAAAGCTLLESQIPAFEEFLQNEFYEIFQDQDLAPRLTYHGIIDISGATQELCHDITKFAPFGMGNPTPKFRLITCYILWKEILSGGHLKMTLVNDRGQRLQAMAFRAEGTPLQELMSISSKTPVEFLGTLQLDTFFQDSPKVKFLVEDARIVKL